LRSPNALYENVVTGALEEIDLSSEGFVIFGWVRSVSKLNEDGNKFVVWDHPARNR